MSRLSCSFCIMASKEDLRLAAQLRPELYAKYVELEKRTGHTFLMPSKGVARGLEEVTGIKARASLPVIQPTTGASQLSLFAAVA